MIDWLIDWLTDWLTDWLIDWLTVFLKFNISFDSRVYEGKNGFSWHYLLSLNGNTQNLTFKNMWWHHDEQNWNDLYSNTNHFYHQLKIPCWHTIYRMKCENFRQIDPSKAERHSLEIFKTGEKTSQEMGWFAYICINLHLVLTHFTTAWHTKK